MTKIEVVIYEEDADGETVWWATSHGIPGFTASGPSLSVLRHRLSAAVPEILEEPVEIVERFAGPEDDEELDRAS